MVLVAMGSLVRWSCLIRRWGGLWVGLVLVNGHLVLTLVNDNLALVLVSGDWTWVGGMTVLKQYLKSICNSLVRGQLLFGLKQWHDRPSARLG